MRVRPISGGFSKATLGPEMERGRALIGSLASGFRARVATLRLQDLRPTKPSKEPHDSFVPVFPVATHEAVPAPRARISAPAPRTTTTKPVRSLRRTTNGVPPRDDDPGFLPDVTSIGRGGLAMSSDRDSLLSGRCKVLPRAITRSSLAWDRRRGATCVLEVIRQIVHAPARDERRTCGPYQKGTRSGVVKASRPINWAAWGKGWPSRLIAGEGSNGRGCRVRAAIDHPRRRQRWHAGKVM